jgi:hypothetical protein
MLYFIAFTFIVSQIMTTLWKGLLYKRETKERVGENETWNESIPGDLRHCSGWQDYQSQC